MRHDLEAVLSMSTSEERRAWFQTHAPQVDDTLINTLREQSYHEVRDTPQTALSIAAVVADAAGVWKHENTRAVALIIEANARRALAEHQQASTLYEAASDIYRAQGLELDAARATIGQIDAMIYLGRYAEARTLASRAINLFQTHGDDFALGKMLNSRGNIYFRLNLYEQARDDYQRAHQIFTALDNHQYLAMVAANDANVLTEQDDFRAAEGMYQESRHHFEAAGMAIAVAQVDHNLAYLAFAQGDYQRALATYMRARAPLAAQGSAVDVAYIDLYRTETFLALNLWQEALDLARAARPVFEKASMAWEAARLWLNEATALARSESSALANTALSNARQTFADQENTVWLAITDLYQATFAWRQENYGTARTHAKLAQDVFQRFGLLSRTARCEVLLGEISLGEAMLDQAAHHFARGIEMLAHVDLPAIVYICHFGLGRIYRARGAQTEALGHLRQAVADIERLQSAIGAEDYKIAFASDKLAVYEELILLCLEISSPEAEFEAFETLERAKSRVLLDTLARETPLIDTAADEESNELLQEFARLKQELNWYYNRINLPSAEQSERSAEQAQRFSKAIAEREHALSQVLKQLRTRDQFWARQEAAVVPPETVQAALPIDTLLLEYCITREQLIVFGLTHQTMWTERLPIARANLVDLLGQLRFQMNKFGYGAAYRQRHANLLRQSVDDVLHRLYQALVEPLVYRLTAKTLVIAPHGLLHYVPFHALYTGTHYLLEHMTIAYTPSASMLRYLTQTEKGPAQRAPLIIGLSDEAIPLAEQEAEALAGVFPLAQVLTGQRATVTSLSANREGPAFLHLATHATFRTDNPLFSALKLADGWVTVNDIYEMPDSAPLITLSACETGRNQISVGDELVGLCRGFFRAGAQSLVVSLWAVDDASTARLMVHFYQMLAAGESACSALRSAQLMLMAEQAHPYYWAPFFTTGNPWIKLTQLSPEMQFS